MAFVPAATASSKRRSSTKAIPIPINDRFSLGSTGLMRTARSKLWIASSDDPATLYTQPLAFHAVYEFGLSATARFAISIALSYSLTTNAKVKAANVHQ